MPGLPYAAIYGRRPPPAWPFPRVPYYSVDQMEAYGQAMAEHAVQRLDIKAAADVISDAAARYAGGYVTNFEDVAREAIRAAAQPQEGFDDRRKIHR